MLSFPGHLSGPSVTPRLWSVCGEQPPQTAQRSLTRSHTHRVCLCLSARAVRHSERAAFGQTSHTHKIDRTPRAPHTHHSARAACDAPCTWKGRHKVEQLASCNRAACMLGAQGARREVVAARNRCAPTTTFFSLSLCKQLARAGAAATTAPHYHYHYHYHPRMPPAHHA